MKNLFKFIAPVAVAAVALVSCQKEVNNDSALDANAITIRVHASAQDLVTGNPETKTYLGTYNDTPNTVLWGTGEYMKLAITYGEGEGLENKWATSTEASADAFDGEPEAMFEFSVTPQSAASYLYQGLYPASAAVANNNNDPTNYKVNLLPIQNATADSYDPAAYIMVAKPETFTSVQTDWEASYRRATALNKITLKNVPSGVSIKRVTITAPSGKYLAGARHIDLSTGNSGDIYNGGGRTETVEVKYATPVAGGSNIDVWFTSWDVEVEAAETLTIVAFTTNQQSYTKTITVPSGKSIKFQEGCLNTLGANMSGITPETVTELEEGDYVILAKNGDNYYAVQAALSGNHLASQNYTGSLDSYYGDADLIWSITASDGSYIIANSDKYIGYKNSSNEAYWLEPDETWTSDNYLIDITWDETNSCYHATLHNNSARKFSRNASSNYFAFYTSDQQKDLVFVPATVDSRTAVSLTFDNAPVSLTTAAGSYDEFLGLDVTADPNVPAITNNLSWSYVDEDGIIDEFEDGALTLTGTVGTATVTVSFAGDENYRSAEASYTITVSSATGPQYELVSAVADVVEGQYVITWDNSLYLPNAAANTNPAVGSGITVSGTKLTNTVTDAMLWTFTGNNTDGFAITAGSNRLISTNAAQGISVATSGNTTWKVSVDNTYGMLLKGSDTGTRYLAVYNSSSWRYYGTGANYTGTLRLYKLADTREEAGMSWSSASATATIDNGDVITFTAPTLTAGHATGISYNSSDTDVATISDAGVVSVIGGGTTTIQAVFAGDTNYKPATAEYTLTVTDNRSITIAQVLSKGAGTYKISNLLVYSVVGNQAIVGDNTGKMVLYKSGHGLEVGDNISIPSATVADHNGILQIQDGDFNENSNSNAINHGSAITLNDATIASNTLSSFSASGYHAASFVTMSGTQSGRNIIGANTTLYLSLANTTYDGKGVNVTGYIYYYNSSFFNYNFQLVSIEENNTIPTISVSPSSLSWAAAETNSKTLTVTLNGGADAGEYGYIITSGTADDWILDDNGTGTITVSPRAANTSTSDAKSLTIKIYHTDDNTVYQEVDCSQGKAGNTTTTEEITSGSFSGDTNSLSLTTSSGITISQLKGSGSDCNSTYNTVSTLRVYRANQMQFKGKTFTKIEMYYTGTYSGVDWSVIAGGGTVTIDTTNKKVVWTNTAGASTVTLQNSTSSGTNTQLRTTKFYFEY